MKRNEYAYIRYMVIVMTMVKSGLPTLRNVPIGMLMFLRIGKV